MRAVGLAVAQNSSTLTPEPPEATRLPDDYIVLRKAIKWKIIGIELIPRDNVI